MVLLVLPAGHWSYLLRELRSLVLGELARFLQHWCGLQSISDSMDWLVVWPTLSAVCQSRLLYVLQSLPPVRHVLWALLRVLLVLQALLVLRALLALWALLVLRVLLVLRPPPLALLPPLLVNSFRPPYELIVFSCKEDQFAVCKGSTSFCPRHAEGQAQRSKAGTQQHKRTNDRHSTDKERIFDSCTEDDDAWMSEDEVQVCRRG